jgi:hypothetical protein
MINIIYNEEFDRWVKGDRLVRPLIRRIIRGRQTRLSGMQRVVHNFLKGLEAKGIKYNYNQPIFTKRNDKIISFGMGRQGLLGIKKSNPLIAAIGFPFPAEIPDLCNSYNVKKYLQHSDWILDYTRSANIYPSDIFDLWPAGINTDEWYPVKTATKTTDILIYNKIRWNKEKMNLAIRQPIINLLNTLGLTFKELVYGNYYPGEYMIALQQCKGMIFLVEHESQGIACQECLSSDIPIFAWDQGYCLDPDTFKNNKPIVPATSIPFFDERCGTKFKDFQEFEMKFQIFWEAAINEKYRPREYIMENLTLEKSAEKMLSLYRSI